MRSKFFSFNNVKPSFIPAILWLVISIILLTLPGSSFPSENWFDKIWLDKWIHIGLFAVLVILWSWALQRRYPGKSRLKKIIIYVGLASLSYGAGMEFIQKYFIPNRSFEPGDIIADGIGCVVGIIFSLWRYIKK